MPEQVAVISHADSYEEAIMLAIVKVKNFLPEESQVFRKEEPNMNELVDWYVEHSEADISPGGNSIALRVVFELYGSGM